MARRLQQLLDDKRARRAALLIALWVPVLVALLVVREVLLPFMLATLLAYVIAPAVRWLSSIRVANRRLPRAAAVLALYVGFVGILVLGGRLVVPQLYREVARLAKDGTDILNRLDDEHIAQASADLRDFIQRAGLPVEIVTPDGSAGMLVGAEAMPPEVDAMAGAPVVTPSPDAPKHIVARADRPPSMLTIDLGEMAQSLLREGTGVLRAETSKIVRQLQTVVGGVLRFIFGCFLVMMITAFITIDNERIKTFVMGMTPIEDRTRFEELLARIDHGLSGVVRGQLTICLINGALTLVGLLILRVKFALLLACVASVFSLIPIFGSILSTIPIVIVALSGGVSVAALAVLWIGGIHALEANFLNPKIMGDAAKIHPVVVVLALIVGEHFFGLVGALLAVPLLSIIVTLYKTARSRAITLDEEIHVE